MPLKVIHTDKEDNDLIDLYKSTKNSIFLAQLFERYFHLAYGVCLKHINDPDDAKDICMEIYELLAEKLLIHDITYYKSWLYRVTYNQCMQFLRTKNKSTEIKRLYKLDQKENMEFDLFQHPTIDREELILHLEECIENLKKEQKKSIKLFYIEQRCYNEIVHITGYALKKVKSYIQNGKRNLKICMESKSE